MALDAGAPKDLNVEDSNKAWGKVHWYLYSSSLKHTLLVLILALKYQAMYLMYLQCLKCMLVLSSTLKYISTSKHCKCMFTQSHTVIHTKDLINS